MDEINVNSSLAGVVLRLGDNERSGILVWQSAEPDREEAGATGQLKTIKHKQRSYETKRKCAKCGCNTILSCYNKGEYCYLHSEK